MSPSQRYGSRVTVSTLKPTLWKTSMDRSVTCSSQVFPFNRKCSLGRCHFPPEEVQKQIYVSFFHTKGLNSYTLEEKKKKSTHQFLHKVEKESLWPRWASRFWVPANVWCRVREAEDHHSDPIGSNSWLHHTENQYAATHLYRELWEMDREEKILFISDNLESPQEIESERNKHSWTKKNTLCILWLTTHL